MLLEAICCKEQQKKSSLPVTGLWNLGPLKIMNGVKLILDDQGNHLVLQRSPILQTSNWSGTFFAVSYSKPAKVQMSIWQIGRLNNDQSILKPTFVR